TAYRGAGADAIFLAGIKTRQELEAIAAKLPPPILLGGTPPDLADTKTLARLGVRVALQPHLTFSSSVAAVYATLKQLREGAPPAAIRGIAPEALMKEISYSGEYRAAIEKFLTAPEG
ncbi:MAG: isocitrate lyase/phosphoenolpyruvate mutase family protein, partial [Acetobacteraceae bacterium]